MSNREKNIRIFCVIVLSLIVGSIVVEHNVPIWANFLMGIAIGIVAPFEYGN